MRLPFRLHFPPSLFTKASLSPFYLYRPSPHLILASTHKEASTYLPEVEKYPPSTYISRYPILSLPHQAISIPKPLRLGGHPGSLRTWQRLPWLPKRQSSPLKHLLPPPVRNICRLPLSLFLELHCPATTLKAHQ